MVNTSPRYTRIMIKRGPDAYSVSWVENEGFSPFHLVPMSDEEVHQTFQYWIVKEVFPRLVPAPGSDYETYLMPMPYEFWNAQSFNIKQNHDGAYLQVVTYLWTPEHKWLVKDLSKSEWMDKSGWETLSQYLTRITIF